MNPDHTFFHDFLTPFFPLVVSDEAPPEAVALR